MRLRLKQKLFLILLGSSLLIIGGMMLFMHYSIESGFRSYLEEESALPYEQFAITLENGYKWNGSWEFLKENPEKWDALLRASVEAGWFSVEEMPPDAPEGDVATEIPGNILEEDFLPDTTHVRLLDTNNTPIFGGPKHNGPEAFIPLYDGETPIGTLAFPAPEFVDGAEFLYLEKQTQMIWLMGAAMVLFSIVLSLAVAYFLKGPIQELKRGTQLLASGSYDFRIPIKSRDEIGDLCRDFNELAHVLEQNEAARQKWVADISHELRTPLALLSGEVEAIQDGVREMNRETVSLLHKDISQLTRLVKDLEELSRSDLGALSYQKAWHPAEALFAHTANTFKKDFEQKEIRLATRMEGTEGMLLFVDLERVNQLIGNLFQNALRYTHDGGQVEASLIARGDTLILVVEDSPPGVADQDLPHLFDRLYRVEESRNRASGGVGIGLSICRNIVEAHGGIISAAHSRLGGLRVHISFPRKEIASC